MAVLIVESPEGLQRTVELTAPTVVLGRGETCYLTLPDQMVSREHAVVERRDEADTYLVRDLGSRNGTWVNGNRLEAGGRLLRNGDQIRLGKGGPTVKFFHRADDTNDPEATLPELRRTVTGIEGIPFAGDLPRTLRALPIVRLVSASLGGLAAALATTYWVGRLLGAW